MSKKFISGKHVGIKIKNKLLKEQRNINVYHHFKRSGHILSYNSSIIRGVRSADENDYLHISVESGPGYLKNYCILDLPSFLDFKLSLTGGISLIHSGERLLLKIPPGPPVWQLKMTIPHHLTGNDLLTSDMVIIREADE
jgi:hypothetical protein